MPQLRENFQEFTEVLSKIYSIEMKKKTDYAPKFFTMEKSNRSKEQHMGIGAIGLMAPWTGQVSYDEFGKRWKQTYTHLKYSKGLQLERELFDFEEFSEIKRRTRLLAESAYKTRQNHCASVFNYAFDTSGSYNGADGIPLCAATGAGHPYSPDNSTDTQVNAGALDLTVPNVETVQNAMYDFKDDKGEIIGVHGKLLIVGNYYLRKAKELCGTGQIPWSAENTTNIYKGELTYAHCPYITGRKWFLADPDMMKSYLYWYTAREPKIEYTDDHDTEVIKYKLVGLWSYGWDEWFWIYGNNVAA